jgi:ubiquinone/menaquinone biosynthesis C-methylase UbiE
MPISQSGDVYPMLHKTQQQEHYNRIAAAYTQARQNNLCNAQYYAYLSQSLFSLIPRHIYEKGALTILDPMCGSAELLEDVLHFLGGRVARFIGIDISENMLAQVRPHIQADTKAHFQQGDIRVLPLESNSVDLVLIRGGLHHVYRDMGVAIEQLYRVLKPGGAFVFFEPSDDNPMIEWARNCLYRHHDFFMEDEEKGLKSAQVQQRLHQAGFKNISIMPFGYIAYTLIGNTDVLPIFGKLTHPAVIQSLIKMDDIWMRTPVLNKLGFAFIGCAEKYEN